MISYSQIQKISSQKNILEEIIEKDYLIELILYFVAKDKYLQERFIFRGGTALKKIFFKDFRLSEDLDFLMRFTENFKIIETKLNNLLEKINSNYPVQLIKKSEYEKDRWQIF